MFQLVLVMAFMSFVSIKAMPLLAHYQRMQVIQTTRISMEMLAQSATAYRADEPSAWYGTWPTLGMLAAADYGLTTATPINPRGNPYTFTISTGTTTALAISTEMMDEGEARDLVAHWGTAGAYLGRNIAALIVPVPGQESSHDELVWRNGDKSVQGTLIFEPGAQIILQGSPGAVNINASGKVLVKNTDTSGTLEANIIYGDIVISGSTQASNFDYQ